MKQTKFVYKENYDRSFVKFFLQKLDFEQNFFEQSEFKVCEVIFYKVSPAPAGPVGPSTLTDSGKARQSSGVFKPAQVGLFPRI